MESEMVQPWTLYPAYANTYSPPAHPQFYHPLSRLPEGFQFSFPLSSLPSRGPDGTQSVSHRGLSGFRERCLSLNQIGSARKESEAKCSTIFIRIFFALRGFLPGTHKLQNI